MSYPYAEGNAPEECDPDFWFENIHSASDALEAAREILKSPSVLICGTHTAEILFICSELLFRVTGEKVAPDGMQWYGNELMGPCVSWHFKEEP